MTREIELAAATIGDISVNMNQLRVTWDLQVSKVDTPAKAVSRTHGCGRGSDHQLSKICPCHTLTRHYSDTSEFYCTKFQRPKGSRSSEYFQKLPLFPDSHAKFLSKNMVIEAIRQAARACGTEMTKPTVNSSTDMHSGAQFMARHGIELYMIQLLGRKGLESSRTVHARSTPSQAGISGVKHTHAAPA